MNKVGVILVNWNGGQLTKECIDSLIYGSEVPDYIVVVDNNSKDDSINILTESFGERIIFIKNDDNKGFAEANNQGIALLSKLGAEHIWLLNNDTVVDKECLKELLIAQKSYSDEKIAAVSSKIFYETEREKIWYAGANRNNYSFAIKHCTEDIKEDIKTSFISGCCIFAKTEVFRKYGGLQSKFIAYSEDDEWCLRLEQDGKYFMCISKSILYHKVSASLKKNTGTYNMLSDRAFYLMNRNHYWVIRKYAPHKLLAIIVMLGISLRNMIIIKTERKRLNIHFKSTYHGLFDDISFLD